MESLELKPFQVERPWGTFRQFTHNELSTVKIHRMLPEGKTSLQSHAKRSEFWHIVEGGGIIQIGGEKHKVGKGDEYNAQRGMKHRWMAGPSGMVILEIAIGDFDEEDIVRFEDEYGRAT